MGRKSVDPSEVGGKEVAWDIHVLVSSFDLQNIGFRPAVEKGKLLIEFKPNANGKKIETYKSKAIFGIWTMYRGTTRVRRRGRGDLLRLVLEGLRSSFFSRSLLSSLRRFRSTSSSSTLRSRGDRSLVRLVFRFCVATALALLVAKLLKELALMFGMLTCYCTCVHNTTLTRYM